MGRRGPPPKPTVLKLAAGNPGRRPLNEEEPIPPAGEPVPPFELSPPAKMVWDQLVPGLAKIGLARSIDGMALARYCVLFSQWIQLKDHVERGGMYKAVKDKNGIVTKVITMPHMRELRQMSALLLQLEREFGLTAASRTRIRIEKDKAIASGDTSLREQFFGLAQQRNAAS